MRNHRVTGMLLLLLAIAQAGCREQATDTRHSAAALLRATERGPVQVSITVDPPRVRYERDTLVTVRLTAPTNIVAALPDMQDRFTGMLWNGSYDDEPHVRDGQRIQTRHARYTPQLEPEYRLKPLVIVYGREADAEPLPWFTTDPIRLETASLIAGEAPDRIDAGLEPVWIRPPAKTVALWSGAVLLGIALLGALVFALRRVKRHIEVRRLSPGERALRELRLLLAKRLPEKHEIKTFYVELTMIVRRYIERAHGIRAPEQTTEEFLAAVSRDRRFGGTVLDTLTAFLEAADLVKFAAFRPDRAAIDRAVETARTYIETDSRTPDSRNNPTSAE